MTGRFQPSLVRGLDEPVQRFFIHAIADGAALTGRVRLTMKGRVKVGAWLPFAAEQSVVFVPSMVLPGRGVSWRAEGEDVIVGRFDLPPERPEVRARIDEYGRLRTCPAASASAGGSTRQAKRRSSEPASTA